MRILIIRHAEPDYSKDSLTLKGFKEAEYLADRLEKMNIGRVFCSPLGRAKDTIRPYCKRTGKKAIILPWLQEFRGSIYTDTQERTVCWDLLPAVIGAEKEELNFKSWIDEFPYNTGDAGEIYKSITESFFNHLKLLGYEKEGNYYNCSKVDDEILVFCCHFALGSVLISALTGIAAPLLWQGVFLSPSSVTSFVTEEREKGRVQFRCEYMGDISHLYKNDEPMSYSGAYAEIYTGKKAVGSLV